MSDECLETPWCRTVARIAASRLHDRGCNSRHSARGGHRLERVMLGVKRGISDTLIERRGVRLVASLARDITR